MSAEIARTRRTGWWFVASGVVVTARAAIELSDPTYWGPTSFVDYAAVIGSTVAWLLAAWAVFALSLLPPLRRAAPALWIGALGTAVSAIGNLMEDLMGLSIGGEMFEWGGLVGAIGVLLGAVLTMTVKDKLRWSGLFLLGFIAGSTFPDDGGQFLSGASLVGLGIWLLATNRTVEVGA